MSTTNTLPERILVIDDERPIHEAYRAILCPRSGGAETLDALDAAVFGTEAKASEGPSQSFEVSFASQGQQGLEMLKAARAEGRPFRMAFVDMRMPPGWDGVETVEQLWKADPSLDVVICTAYSDHPWEQVASRLGQTHRLLLLRKPFEAAEVWQMACSLCSKRRAEDEAAAGRAALEASNAQLRSEMEARQTVEGRLKFDALTGLPNRLLLHERIERCIERSKREPDFHYAVLFLDLDDFKSTNDSLGHAIGDALLIEVGKRLKKCIRTLDTASRIERDTPARLGGDEFVLLLDGVRNIAEVQTVSERLRRELSEPVLVAGRELAISASIGYALGGKETLVPDDVLRDADAALYQAKAGGKGQIRAFDESIRQKLMTNRRLSVDVQDATSKGQLRVLYQPVVSLESGAVESFEALVRWQHPELGFISPAIFIPVAEETGAIHEIGLWVLRESCQQLRIWHERFPARKDLTMSVNVSCRQLGVASFVDDVARTLAEVGLPGSFVNMEITESVFIDNVEAVCGRLAEIRKMGIHLHLDDFGTGYSSLSSFHNLPIDAIKIDRSFVSNMALDGRVANIVQAIQVMANNRDLIVVAEGIETIEQLAQLQALGCTRGQGYYMSRPVDAVAAQELLRKNEMTLTEPGVKWPGTGEKAA